MPRILSGLGERGREAYLTDRLSSLLGPLHSVAFPPEPVMDLLHGACHGDRAHHPPPPLDSQNPPRGFPPHASLTPCAPGKTHPLHPSLTPAPLSPPHHVS